MFTVDTRVPPEPPQTPYEELPVISQQDALDLLARQIYQRVARECFYSDEVKKARPEELVMLGVHTVLDTLENGYQNLPAFNLLPVQSLYQDEMPRVSIYVDDGNYKEVRFSTPVVLAGSRADGDPTLTGAFEEVYDQHKHRMYAAARDLFATTYILDRNTEYE